MLAWSPRSLISEPSIERNDGLENGVSRQSKNAMISRECRLPQRRGSGQIRVGGADPRRGGRC